MLYQTVPATQMFFITSAAGIPDFRTPGTGLYDNLQKYNLPSPHSIFDLNYFLVSQLVFEKLPDSSQLKVCDMDGSSFDDVQSACLLIL